MGDLEKRIEEIELRIESHEFNLHGKDQLWEKVVDFQQRFDTLQTSLWKRLWFRIDGWPGQKNLNAARRSWRPWHRNK